MIKTISKKQIIGLCIAVALVVTVLLLVNLLQKNSNNQSTDSEPRLQTEQEIAEEVARSERFDEFLDIVNGTDPKAKIEKSREFAQDSRNGMKSRLDSYRVCMQTANELADDVNKSSCFTEARVLLEQLSEEQDRSYWNSYLESVNQGSEFTNQESEADVVQ
jgi:ABC-type lipoprotein release transport system permease subunit